MPTLQKLRARGGCGCSLLHRRASCHPHMHPQHLPCPQFSQRALWSPTGGSPTCALGRPSLGPLGAELHTRPGDTAQTSTAQIRDGPRAVSAAPLFSLEKCAGGEGHGAGQGHTDQTPGRPDSHQSPAPRAQPPGRVTPLVTKPPCLCRCYRKKLPKGLFTVRTKGTRPAAQMPQTPAQEMPTPHHPRLPHDSRAPRSRGRTTGRIPIED